MLLPLGFVCAGVHCGIKTDPDKRDLTLIHCPGGALGAGVYTQNLFRAAPVEWDRRRTPTDDVRVVVVNSGNANACTGERGWQDAVRMAELAASACQADPEQTLVMSTGVIGHYLPMDKLRLGIQDAAAGLSDSDEAFQAAAEGMLTTDNGPKCGTRRVLLDDRTEVRIAGLVKGAAMIGPQMATMLGMFLTDARLEMDDAQATLARAVDRSFHCISVEGHMSTNDTVLLLASGQARRQSLAGGDLERFAATLDDLAIELAKMIPNDGEGATHLITIDVSGCRGEDEARRIARCVASSALVKTAVTGGDPNWGRVMSAAGYAGVPFDPVSSSLRINGHLIFDRGAPADYDEQAVSDSMRRLRETRLELGFAEGTAAARFWTSDLTLEYVRFNADYRT